MRYIIGLDIGTTSAKTVIFNKKGHVISEHEEGYDLLHSAPEYAEQDGEAINTAAMDSVRLALEKGSIKSKDVIGVGLSSAMHSLLCVDKQGRALSPSITWADRRSVNEAEYLKDNHSTVYLRTGTPLHPMSPLSKLIWMKNHHYEPYQKAYKYVSIKEYVLYRWFGEFVVDYSVAASSGMYDIHKQDWDETSLKLAGISRDQLSRVVPATHEMKGLSKEASDLTGLASSTPFIIGGSDGPLANLGIGAIEPGETAVTIGTSGAIRQFASIPAVDEKQDVFCYSFTEDLWITGGPTNNGGIVLNWLKDLFSNEGYSLSFDQLNHMAARVKPGSEGLLFLPYLNGERAPFWDASAKANFIGLRSTHGKEHMVRAGMEGVIYSIYHIAHELERLGHSHDALYASGGFARSPLWTQMLSDVFGKPVHIPKSHQSSAWGAAWTALYSLGEVPSLHSIKTSIPMNETIEPNQANYQTYQQTFKIYKELYPAIMKQLKQLQSI
ncbi:gluconokinase [Pontibacillus chungwhensis BH030062]|uniref:Gluconokinase n=1 Tax=Pontibacillus chungwhensis BH030062 TaxID=1385513 RepID=A0A0A2US93_9BACI|nr:gluconokinase [Pontibacillus chungwhensis]KGP89643.1 gluconokinase [Pontibacillus chungwhensis BH030062]